MKKIKDLTGQKFNLLTVIEVTDKRVGGSVVWQCVCECGNTTYVSSGNLRSGHTKSCGCHKKITSSEVLKNLLTKHGQSKTGNTTPAYNTWLHMINRCNNPKNDSYPNYGGRGITVCEEWKDFKSFFADMGDRSLGTTLDRIDNNKGYYKDNCRWATQKVQQNNKRNTQKYDYLGESLTITELAIKYNIDRDKLYYRLNKAGWSVEKALSEK